MAQVKVYGNASFLAWVKDAMSDAIHECTTDVLGVPQEKRCHRCNPLKEDWFDHPMDRSERYVIIEVMMMEGRTVETRKNYVRALMDVVGRKCGIQAKDIEITLVESPRENWGIRGKTGDELQLGYEVEK